MRLIINKRISAAFRCLCLMLFVFLCIASKCSANQEVFPTPTEKDRVLVVAYQPQDEILGAYGLIQKAKSAKSAVKITYLTLGESNELSAIFYQKRPLLLKKDFVKSGLIHQKEAQHSLSLAGLKSEDLIFLGYPDGGISQMWIKYWSHNKNYRSLLTRFNTVPFETSPSYQKPYRPQELVKDLEKIISEYKPTILVLPAAYDLSAERQAANLFTWVALKNAQSELPDQVTVYNYLIRAKKWPNPKKYMPNEYQSLPGHIDLKDIKWLTLKLTPQEVDLKAKAIQKMQSQYLYKKDLSLSFARRSEIFAVDGQVSATKTSGILYQVTQESLLIKIPRARATDEAGVMSYYVFPYKNQVDFSAMPKLTLKFFGNKLGLYEGSKELSNDAIEYNFLDKQIEIKIPIALLKEPDFIFTSARNSKEKPSLDFGSWRMISLITKE